MKDSTETSMRCGNGFARVERETVEGLLLYRMVCDPRFCCGRTTQWYSDHNALLRFWTEDHNQRHTKPASNVLERANALVAGEKRKEYGDAYDCTVKVAKMWSVIIGVEVTPMQTALAMAALKIVREVQGHKMDNLDDLAGYAWVAEQIVLAESKKAA